MAINMSNPLVRRALTGAGYGAAIGGVAGLVDDDSTVIHGALTGAAFGAGLGVAGHYGGIFDDAKPHVVKRTTNPNPKMKGMRTASHVTTNRKNIKNAKVSRGTYEALKDRAKVNGATTLKNAESSVEAASNFDPNGFIEKKVNDLGNAMASQYSSLIPDEPTAAEKLADAMTQQYSDLTSFKNTTRKASSKIVNLNNYRKK